MEIDHYLKSCRELTAFCTQNGWIDNDTLQYELVDRDGDRITASVHFDEVLMEGSGCPAGRVRCWGKLRLRLDEQGQVTDAEILMG